ncbi:MAG TPA: head GIN domain-containing protein [Chitinophagales bacterium]|nr:head GIN domain-containing protein [Chitinophagales bacterium]
MKIVSIVCLCVVFAVSTVAAQTGSVRKEMREAAPFTSIVAMSRINVQINHGNAGTIEVSADESELAYVDTYVKDGTLYIGEKEKNKFRSSQPITVAVSLMSFDAITASGSGTVRGSGDFTNADAARITVSGSGNVELEFKQINKLTVGISGSGDAILKGQTDKFTVATSGSGDVNSFGLVTNKVIVAGSGSGDVNVSVNGPVEASLSGSGNVNYKGTATDIREHATGSGHVRKS